MTDEQLLQALQVREVGHDELSQFQLTIIYGLHGEGRVAMSTRTKDGQRRIYWRMMSAGNRSPAR